MFTLKKNQSLNKTEEEQIPKNKKKSYLNIVSLLVQFKINKKKIN